jgi:hypothetical protein
VRAAEIRAIAGFAATSVAFRADGMPVIAPSNIPAELTPAISGTVVGAFNKAFAVVSDETRIVIKRNDKLGKMDVLCHVNIKSGLPDADYFRAG